jgi:SNF2 family DNA or RNA helicase
METSIVEAAIRAEYSSYQRQFWAHSLTIRGPAEESLSRRMASARVDMNPHQVEGALFAVRSPLSKGVILADEVGLGKTIEASLVIAQRWAERRRRILLIVPASLRKQWSQELFEKFGLRSQIIESKNFNQWKKEKGGNPFDQKETVMIASYQFAARKAAEIRAIPWDLVIFDEAHKLRNVYKKEGSKTAKALAEAVRNCQKVLLSATPLQNSLLELYGLVTVIDEHLFGSEAAFKQAYVNGKVSNTEYSQLKERLKNVCTRTLRRQVQEEGGINFTQRLSLTQDFTPSDEEQQLYAEVSGFLQRDGLAAIAKSNKALITLVIRKILASSSFAIAGTLEKMIARLAKKLDIDTESLGDYDAVDEVADELDADETAEDAAKRELLKEEIAELRKYEELARGIKDNAKGQALVTVLETAFSKVEELGGARKAVLFTESVRTQSYLKELLEANGYEGQIILLNGSNSDPTSQQVYKQWLERHKGSDVISGSKSADVKAAVVEQFRDHATILIATESGAEGINLQFCSLVINYDLPWNPQRVEQRIGRCHRYGQKHDVVVVNFINKRNRADERVFELLDQKFKLFNGVFGASDEILGAIESGVDIEQRILDVYQNCRTSDQIEAEFETLQQELDDKIKVREENARQILLENFDEAVHEVLRSRREKTNQSINEIQTLLLRLCKASIGTDAQFSDGGFVYKGEKYHIDWKKCEEEGGHFLRLGDEALVDSIIQKTISDQLSPAVVRFRYEGYGKQLSDLKPFIGKGGWLELSKLSIDSLEVREFLVLAGYADDGQELDEVQLRRLLGIPSEVAELNVKNAADAKTLKRLRDQYIAQFVSDTETSNKDYLEEETQKLELWSEESLRVLTEEMNSLLAEMKSSKKQARLAESLSDRVELQRAAKSLETKRTKKQMEFFEQQNKITEQHEKLLDAIAAKMELKHEVKPVFLIRWELV